MSGGSHPKRDIPFSFSLVSLQNFKTDYSRELGMCWQISQLDVCFTSFAYFLPLIILDSLFEGDSYVVIM